MLVGCFLSWTIYPIIERFKRGCTSRFGSMGNYYQETSSFELWCSFQGTCCWSSQEDYFRLDFDYRVRFFDFSSSLLLHSTVFLSWGIWESYCLRVESRCVWQDQGFRKSLIVCCERLSSSSLVFVSTSSLSPHSTLHSRAIQYRYCYLSTRSKTRKTSTWRYKDWNSPSSWNWSTVRTTPLMVPCLRSRGWVNP